MVSSQEKKSYFYLYKLDPNLLRGNLLCSIATMAAIELLSTAIIFCCLGGVVSVTDREFKVSVGNSFLKPV